MTEMISPGETKSSAIYFTVAGVRGVFRTMSTSKMELFAKIVSD